MCLGDQPVFCLHFSPEIFTVSLFHISSLFCFFWVTPDCAQRLLLALHSDYPGAQQMGCWVMNLDCAKQTLPTVLFQIFFLSNHALGDFI